MEAASVEQAEGKRGREESVELEVEWSYISAEALFKLAGVEP